MTRAALAAAIILLLANACEDAAYRNGPSVEGHATASGAQSEVTRGEYIVVLNTGGDIEAIIEVLKRYGAEMLRDLGRDRYLVALAHDPGIDHLQADPELVRRIRLIQPNYDYSSQPE